MDDYEKFRFSITCRTADDGVLNCLRALCQWAEEYPKQQIGWGGTTLASWKRSNGEFKLRFTDPNFRDRFVRKAQELLPDRWTALATNDNDPAKRQRLHINNLLRRS
jgi:hypothetical protein